MTHMIIVMAFALSISIAAPAFTQPSPVHLHVDVPATSDWRGPIPVTFGAWYIAGWTFNCYTGQQPPDVKVFYASDQIGELEPVPDAYVHWRLERPDVQAAAPGICSSAYVPAVHLPNGPYLGFAIGFPTPIPRGRRVVVVKVTDPVFSPTTDPAMGTKYWQSWLEIQ